MMVLKVELAALYVDPDPTEQHGAVREVERAVAREGEAARAFVAAPHLWVHEREFMHARTEVRHGRVLRRRHIAA